MRLLLGLGVVGLAFSVSSCCCCYDQTPRNEYLSEVPKDDVLGEWSTSADSTSWIAGLRDTWIGRSSLALSTGGTCTVSPGLADTLLRCDHTQPEAPPGTGTCTWRVDAEAGGEWIGVVFQKPKGEWRVAHFSVWRQISDRELVLFGTCGMGDAYRLFRAAPQQTPST